MNKAIKHSIPALLCYFPLGIVYGLLFVQHGHPWYFAPLFSVFVFAGAMQFLALSLALAGASTFTILLAIIPLGIRNVFYGMTMIERFKPLSPFWRAYLAYGLVDATYSILVANPPRSDGIEEKHYIKTLTICIHLSWVLGTLVGAVVDNLFSLPEGLEFCLVAFFAASAVEHIRTKKEVRPLVIAGASIALALFLAPGQFFLAGVGMAAVIVLVLPEKRVRVAV